MGLAGAIRIAERARVHGGFEDRHEAQRRVKEWLAARDGCERETSVWGLVAGIASERRESGDPIRDIVRETWYGAWLGILEHARELIEAHPNERATDLLRRASESAPRFPSEGSCASCAIRDLLSGAVEALGAEASPEVVAALRSASELLGR